MNIGNTNLETRGYNVMIGVVGIVASKHYFVCGKSMATKTDDIKGKIRMNMVSGTCLPYEVM